MWKFILILCFFFSPMVLLPCEPFVSKSLPPIDHSSKDKSFLEFKTKLQKVLKSKDRKGLEAIIDSDIHFSFGPESGKKDFLKSFQLTDKPNESDFWNLLTDTIQLGFRQNQEGQMVAPYFFETFPSDYDPFSHYLIIGKNVNVREDASKDSKSLGLLSYQIVRSEADDLDGRRMEKESNCNWKKICTPQGKAGFVCDRFIRSPLDYRAFFEKRKDKWVLSIFVVGD
ncbi:SH3 domain-containing protein [Leptospira kemamanensis]|uniref:SH3 domain-containing protein n=1 Tax=Leptospira kemamanensis TaxID=2484942 RepID=A0A4R9JUG1_9LEPT|nr:SH3 domain-containing protein [Leptospira kemamanensis]TGL55583.1 SH3 domain-containing protein [Leptospira kemamanensis]